MKRTDLMDTSEWAHREIVKRLRAMTPEERIRIMLQRIDLMRTIHLQALKRQDSSTR